MLDRVNLAYALAGGDYEFGRIGPNFGSTNMDNIPSSGGAAGYTRDVPTTGIAAPTPTRYYTTQDGGVSITPPSTTGGYNTTQSGDVSASALDKLLALYGSFAATGAGASSANSGGGVLVLSPDQGTAPASGSASSRVVIYLVLAAAAYAAYRWYKNRS